MMRTLASNGVVPAVVRMHCLAKSTLEFFEASAREMAKRLPSSVTIEFVRWEERAGGDQIHNRYVLTDLGGVLLGAGIDAGPEGQTDDIQLLSETTYMLRWAQYVDNNGAFTLRDVPSPIKGLLA